MWMCLWSIAEKTLIMKLLNFMTNTRNERRENGCSESFIVLLQMQNHRNIDTNSKDYLHANCEHYAFGVSPCSHNDCKDISCRL